MSLFTTLFYDWNEGVRVMESLLTLGIVLENDNPKYVIVRQNNESKFVELKEINNYLEVTYEGKATEELKNNYIKSQTEREAIITLEQLIIKGYKIEYV